MTPAPMAGPDPHAGWRRRLVDLALEHPVRALLLAYAGSRLVVFVVMWIAAVWAQNPAGVGHEQPGVSDLFGLWDGTWYGRIARHGYPVPVPADPSTGWLTYSAWAFYPLFPMLVRGPMMLGLPFVASGAVLSLVLGALGVVLVWQVFRSGPDTVSQSDRERLALAAAVLWCFHPATGVLMQPYTEALAVVLLTLVLLAMQRRWYVWAALGTLVLGLTRAVAPALLAVVLVQVLIDIRADRVAGRPVLAGRRLSTGVLALTTAVSAVLWPLYVGWRTGIPTAFLQIQAAWGQRPTDGLFRAWLRWSWDAHGLLGLITVILLVVAYVALVAGRHGAWLSTEVRVFAMAYPIYLMAVVRPITSMWRFALIDVPLAALVASVALRTANGARIVTHWPRRVVVALIVLSVGILWWTCALWVYTPWGSSVP
ncbi:MAG: hypothetical protein ACK5MP_13955 [Nostocoides sp.]